MSGSIHGLSWFPNFPNKFVTWGQEINLYEVRRNTENKNSNFINLDANFLASECRYQYVRCVQPAFNKDRPLVAIGLGDGKIGISDFQTPDTSLEYTPRQQRMCTCIAWNEIDTNILAIGHERHRSDTCITIWNITSGPPTETDSLLGHAESVQSMCWDKNNCTLIAGMSQKHIRLFDFRQNAAACQSVSTKCVYGLSVAPSGNYLSSYFDSVITIWDMRSLERPLKQIQSAKNNLQLAWCPTRKSLLSALQRDSPCITLYDIRSVDSEKSRDIYHFKKQSLPFHNKHGIVGKTSALNSISWHWSDFERALLLSDTASILDYKLPLPSFVANRNRKVTPLIFQRPFSATHSATNSTEINLPAQINSLQISCSTSDFLPQEIINRKLLEQDTLLEMHRRALHNYGSKKNFKCSGDFRLNGYLENVWNTLNNLYTDERLIGLKELLGVSQNHTSEALMATSRIESHVMQWPDFFNNSNHLICYRSDQRDRAIKLCGWPNEPDLERFITTLRQKKEFSRAAMIYVFHLKILAACDVLSQAASVSPDPSMFSVAAIALSSFNADSGNSTWRTQRNVANRQIQDAHLRAIFSFLTTENESFDAVLSEEGVSLADRMSFACKYLSESKLADYVRLQIQKSIEKGNLNGLLLTGESLDGINILQAYLDATSDVQTVAFIALNFFTREHFSDNRIQYWILSYFDCLNCWSLWEKRSELEIEVEKIRSTRTARNVYLSCNFCGKSISNAQQDDARMRNASSNINKLSSCPSCRKPLPRCSLCLLHMGQLSDETFIGLSTPFSKWFSWCQTCRHGGHTEHILQWFKKNSECPVSSCTCRCFDLDATMPRNLHRNASFNLNT